MAAYWPEFGQPGKEEVTVRQLLAHEAGLPVIDEPLDADMLADFDRLAEAIARQRPLWKPGTRHGYHGVSLGWYMGELVRRVDPEHRTLGRFFAEEIAGPLELDVHFGVPRTCPSGASRASSGSIRSAPAGPRHLPPRMAVGDGQPALDHLQDLRQPAAALTRVASTARQYRRLEFPAGGAARQRA